MIAIPPEHVSSCVRAARAAFPREASGILVARSRGQVTELSVVIAPHHENTIDSFVIREAAFAAVKDDVARSDGRVCGCFHSHIFGAARPSGVDRAARKAKGELWLIYALGSGRLNLFEWDGAEFDRVWFRVARRSHAAGSS